MVDSDSDAGFDEEIPINSNHERILNLESQWNSNRSKHGHHHRRGTGAGKAGKHHQNRTKTGFSYHDTNEYFELARQARLLSKGDELPGNDPGKHAVLERENEVRDRGKGIVDHGTGGSQVNGSRFQWSKPFRNRKNKLVRNGCISPENVLRVNGSRHNASCPSRHSVEQVVGVVDDKGKGKLGLSDCSGAHKSEAGVMLHEHRETSACNEKRRGLYQRRRNYFTGKRKHRIDQPNLGESSSNPSQKLTIVNSSGEEERERERERDSCSEEYWSVEEPKLNNEELANQSAKITQVESDEILARRLQEQFNQEAQNFHASNEEDDDAIIARALQEADEEFDHDITTSRRNRSEVNNRDRSMEHLYSHNHGFPFEGPPLQIPNRRRTQMRFNSPDMDYEMLLITQLRRGLTSSNMDMDTRLSILEALEEAFENQSDIDISGDIYSGFHADEHEILSTLDEDNHNHAGATDGQINILPISTIMGGRVEDACAICLETPATGDAMRHLPCLHKFHKACIDTWLRRRDACPVCKSAIT